MKTEFTICFNCTQCLDLGGWKYVCTARPTNCPVHPVTGQAFMDEYSQCSLVNTVGQCEMFIAGENNVNTEGAEFNAH